MDDAQKYYVRGILYQLHREIALEVDEVRVCIDRDEPNIDMALRRLTDIMKCIETKIAKHQ